ncbi:hypothetical protein N7486_004041 [Penicillium sp. IBT 16267x]|nr:hypothetical protein N7486_004041 [Penicillium sp. IBT 16267x]
MTCGAPKVSLQPVAVDCIWWDCFEEDWWKLLLAENGPHPTDTDPDVDSALKWSSMCWPVQVFSAGTQMDVVRDIELKIVEELGVEPRPLNVHDNCVECDADVAVGHVARTVAVRLVVRVAATDRPETPTGTATNRGAPAACLLGGHLLLGRKGCRDGYPRITLLAGGRTCGRVVRWRRNVKHRSCQVGAFRRDFTTRGALLIEFASQPSMDPFKSPVNA